LLLVSLLMLLVLSLSLFVDFVAVIAVCVVVVGYFKFFMGFIKVKEQINRRGHQINWWHMQKWKIQGFLRQGFLKKFFEVINYNWSSKGMLDKVSLSLTSNAIMCIFFFHLYSIVDNKSKIDVKRSKTCKTLKRT